MQEDLSLIVMHTTDLVSRLHDRFGGPVTLFIRVKVPDSIWLTNRRLGISTFIVLWDRIAGLLVEVEAVVIGVVSLWKKVPRVEFSPTFMLLWKRDTKGVD